MNIRFTVASKPECEGFLKIRTEGGKFQTVDEFIKEHPDVSENFLNTCVISYRGREIPYKDYGEEYSAFSEQMEFVPFQRPMIILNKSVNAAAYFTQKAIECLQFARFFTMKSGLLIDTDYNIHWSQGYTPQFLFRCIYFGTAATWFSNAFDQVLQSVYWGKALYTSAKDRTGNPYHERWDAKKTMELCNYDFVIGELKERKLTDCRKHLTECSSKIETVRKWANYIKHKGGVDYRYLEAEPPYKVYLVPSDSNNSAEESPSLQTGLPDERFAIEFFKSPVEIDIDCELQKLVVAHTAIFDSITETINDINYNCYSLR